MTPDIQLPHMFRPRRYQYRLLAALDSGVKRVCAVWARRGGKDVTVLNWVIKELYQKKQVCFYCLPTFSQARRVIWDSINNDGMKILDYFPEEIVEAKNVAEMKVTLTNGSVFQLIGSDQYDRLVGTNPKIVVFSEAALSDSRAWEYIKPILAANDGVAIFISTPRGKNWFYDLYQVAKKSEHWFAEILTVDDTKVVSRDDIQRERDEGMSEEMIQQEFYCFKPEAEVMTPKGLIRIDEIKPNDLVLTHAGRWRKVIGTISRDYEGEMIRIKSFGSYEDLVTTPNHPIRVYQKSGQKYSWVAAQDIDIEHKITYPKLNQGSQGKLPIVNPNMCLLMAWYITEGSSFKTGLQFTVNPASDEKDRLVWILENLGIPYYVLKTATALNVGVNSTQLIDFLKTTCGVISHDKRIPLELISGNEEAFFQELIKGDGCHSIHKGHERYVYTTTSKTLAYQVQLLANSLGYTAGVSYKRPMKSGIEARTIKGREAYNVQMSVKKLRCQGKLVSAKYCVAAKVRSISKESYKGPVYNLKVQYDESYVVAGRAVHNCDFNRGVDGTYYGRMISKAWEEHRITSVPYDSSLDVNTSWDLGIGDATAIWMWQETPAGEIHFIDYYENAGEALSHYVAVLREKDYLYGTHYFPHDTKARELGTGATREDMLRKLGIKPSIVPKIPVDDGIQTVRSILPRCWFDEVKCKVGIKHLEMYRKTFSDKLKCYVDRPLHDAASDCADALRYGAISIVKSRKRGMTAEDAAKMSARNSYNVN